MDIVEFAEQICGAKLYEWQKEYLRILEKLPRGTKIVVGPKGRVYTYMDQKELIPNGKTHDCK